MKLSSDEPRMVGELDHFCQAVVGANAAEHHSFFRQFGFECIVNFEPVTMAFMDEVLLVGDVGDAAEGEHDDRPAGRGGREDASAGEDRPAS